MYLAEFQSEMETATLEWEALVAKISSEQMTVPGIAGEWSVKDILAHVTWGEKEMVGILRERALVGSPLWGQTQDERNRVVFEQNKDRSLEDVLEEAQQVGTELKELLEMLTEDDLNDPSHFKYMPEDHHLWQYLVGNTYKHYREHMPALARLVESQADS